MLSLPMDVHGRPLPKRPKDLTKDVQRLAIRLLEESAVKHYEILSLDLINNGILMLMDLGTMYKDKRYYCHKIPRFIFFVSYIF